MSNWPLRPEMTAWSCGEEPFAIGAASMTLALVLARAAGSGVSSSKRRSWQPDGASAEGCDESALHSMKKGSKPLASSFKLSVFQWSTLPSGRLREPGVGPSAAIPALREVGCEHLNVAGMRGPSDQTRLGKFFKHACKFAQKRSAADLVR